MDISMRLTVFTPTYNRVSTLPRLYDSLVSQSSKDFEWLIVDDGSCDNTSDLINKYIKNKQNFSIKYIKKENGGKHTAINRGVIEANGEWFFIVDSDDWLPEDSIATILNKIDEVGDDTTFCGVSGQRYWPNGISAVSGGVQFQIIDSDAIEIRMKYGFNGDMAEVWKTNILKKYPFPEFKGERFFTECFVWYRMAEKYKVRYFNKNIYIGERQVDGLIKNIRNHMHNSPQGCALTYSEFVRNKRLSLLDRIKAAVNYWRYTIGSNINKSDDNRLPTWGYLFWLAGCFFYIKDTKL